MMRPVGALATAWFAPGAAAQPPSDPPSGLEVPISVANTAKPVVEPVTIPDSLAYTGSDVVSLLVAGLMLLAIGVLAVALARAPGPVVRAHSAGRRLG